MTRQIYGGVMLAATLSLTACGGGGGGPSMPPPPPPGDGDSVAQRTVRLQQSVGATRSPDSGSEPVYVADLKPDDALVMAFETTAVAGEAIVTYRTGEGVVPVTFNETGEDDESYVKRMGPWEYNLLVETPRHEPIDGDVEFEYFNIYYAEAVKHTDNDVIDSAEVAYFLHGAQPEFDPASGGTARYAGRFRAKLFEFPESVGTTPSSGFMRSDRMSLTLNFGTGQVTGTIADIEERGRISQGDASYRDRDGQFTITGTLAGGAEMTGTGDLAEWERIPLQTHVFGPAAEEIGGLFEGLNTDRDRGMIGYIAAAQTGN